MRVFAFDPTTGRRGKEAIGEVYCAAFQRTPEFKERVKTPKSHDSMWNVANKASDRRNNPITAAKFGRRAICFCIGKLTAGTDSFWQWVALVDHS